MGTFGKENRDIMAQNIQQQIRQLILLSCEALKKDTLDKGVWIANDEGAITYRLVEFYLNNNEFRRKNNLSLLVRFQIETPVNFQPMNNNYLGRADIRIVGMNYLQNGTSLGLIECKRLDGGAVLKREYVKEGIDRFTGVIAGCVKYPRSNWDMMIGYQVALMQFDVMLKELNQYLKKKMKSAVMKELTFCKSGNDWTECVSTFRCIDGKERPIGHLFYDFAGIIQ